MEQLKEVHSAVQDLNDKWDDITEEQRNNIDVRLFDYTSDGYNYLVKFMDNYIWDSNNEEREWIEEKDDYESLKEYLDTKAKELIMFANSILKIN